MQVIILFSILVVFVVIFLAAMILTRTFISKTNFFYIIPAFLLVWAFYSVGYHYQFGFYDGTSFFETVAAAFFALTFRINREYISALIADNKLYMIGMYVSIALCGATAWSTVIAFVKVSIINGFRVQRRLHTADCDIVYGISDDAIEYCKRNKHAIIWMNPRDKQLDNDAKKSLYLDNVAYVTRPFNAKVLTKFLRLRKHDIQLVCFQENEELLADIFSTIEEMPKDRGPRIFFKVQSDAQHIKHIEKELNIRQEDNDLVSAECFDADSIVARDFSMRHNLAQYLPEGFLKEGVLQPKKNIEVTMYGFAKTGQAVFEALVEQNQFVEVVNGQYQCKPIDFRLFDINQTVFNTGLYAFIQNYHQPSEKELGLPPFELTINATAHVEDVSIDLADRIAKHSIHKDDDTFHVYIVCLNKPMDNAMFADRISSFLDPKHGIVFYCVNYRSEALIKPAPNAIAFGFKGEILRHNCLADDEIRRYAEMQNRIYHRLANNEEKKLYNLPIVEMRSNIAREVNIDFKLALLGLKRAAKTETEQGISKDDFLKLIDGEGHEKKAYDYSAYQTLGLRNLIAYQEHLRWVMYYFVNSFVPMPLNEVKLVDGKVVHKDVRRKTHACLTSFRGLDTLHQYELRLYQEAGINKTIFDVETYKYDVECIDKIYDELADRDYAIIKL